MIKIWLGMINARKLTFVIGPVCAGRWAHRARTTWEWRRTSGATGWAERSCAWAAWRAWAPRPSAAPQSGPCPSRKSSPPPSAARRRPSASAAANCRVCPPSPPPPPHAPLWSRTKGSWFWSRHSPTAGHLTSFQKKMIVIRSGMKWL